ncbi:MAG TPA: ABC transporter permease [Pseudobdellovibrionaceae bacterium]|nr:ABC transporter permease [Pseudobdellovibrionaceae bacterium]
MRAQATDPMSLASTSSASQSVQQNSLWWDAFRRFKRNKVGVISLFTILVYVLIAIGSATGLLYPHASQGEQYLPMSWQHPFGTDIFGRDILGRAVHGTSTAISIGLLASSLSLIIGVVLGALAGYFGKKVDAAVVWLYTVVDSVPYILLIPALTFVLGRGLINVFIAVGLTSWVTTARLVRGEFMKHKDRDYVLAAHAIGAGDGRKIFGHILPNVAHLAFVQFGLGFVAAIKIEVILSYLGLGVDPSQPSWGLMIDDAKNELARPFFGNLAAATLFMFGLILAFNLFNDALREALDPKMKNK